MKIVLVLPTEEGNRKLDDEEDTVRAANRIITRAIEDVCCKHQIRYEEIYITDAEFVES